MTTTTSSDLQELARRHLWLHFSRMGAYDRGAEVPIIVRGDGCYVWDDHGNRYLDALSALSTDSPPPLVKKTRLRSPGASDAIFAASSIDRGWA